MITLETALRLVWVDVEVTEVVIVKTLGTTEMYRSTSAELIRMVDVEYGTDVKSTLVGDPCGDDCIP